MIGCAHPQGLEAARSILRGTFSVQEDGALFWPERPLTPDTLYDIVVPAGGVRDISGNPTATEMRSSFRTVSCAQP